ncbi:MAG: HDOD domain-containing protein [Candidatus Thiodiazotropha sp.]
MGPKKIGRFLLGQKLGAGNQGTVFLCQDSQLERQVAIKLLNRSLQASSFRDEARTMSKLQHPNIVSIYEAGEHQGVPFLVFEYAQGDLLSDLIQGEALELPLALQIFQGLMEGMSEAHKAGIVHRDLKPSNIIISHDQVAKIMDFGIARLIKESRGPDKQLIGTPRYLAPEYIESGSIGPEADVFALGLILDEMLTGMPVFSGHNQQQVVEAILKVAPKPPSQFNSAIDEKLDRFVLKSLEKDPALRYRDAQEMLKAFREIRAPKSEIAATDHDEASGTVDFLLRRMKRKSDFPALSQSVRSINAMTNVSDKDVNQMAGVIVKDFALTNKILKVVNSAFYGRFSGRIGTVSRAVVVLGTQAIRSLAASLIFFEHIENKEQAERLRELVSAAMFRATLAHNLASEIDPTEQEEYFLTGLLNDLGKLLVAFYLPEESRDIERQIEAEGLDPITVQHSVLGVSFERIGMEIAKQWNFPKPLVDSLQAWQGDHKPVNRIEKRRLVTDFANEAMQVIIDQGLDNKSALESLTKKYAKNLDLNSKKVARLAQQSVEEFQEVAKAIATDVSADFMGKLKGGEKAAEEKARSDRAAAQSLNQDGLGETQILDERQQENGEETSDVSNQPSAEETEALLMDGLQEVTGMLVGEHSVSQIFNVVLETMYRAVGFQRVVLALLNRQKGEMAGRLGFGEDSDAFVKAFHFPTTYQVDVFHGALKNAVDVYIADATDAKIQADIPDWYKRVSKAGSFLIFPLVVNKRTLGLIYADHARPHGLALDKKRLNLLKSLRNQIVLAVRG